MTTHPEGLTRPVDDSRALSAQETNVGAPHGAIRARQGEDDAAAVMATGGGVGRSCACRFNDKDEMVECCKMHGDIISAAREMSEATYSHIDGRDLLAQLHPRRMLDIKRRVDGQETWFEGDWLSNVWHARKKFDAALARMTPTAPLQGNAESPSSSDLNATGAITRPPE